MNDGGVVGDQLADAPRGSQSTVGGSPFPAIEDYGFISDCEVCALIAPSGNVEWLCLPSHGRSQRLRRHTGS